MAEKIYVGNLSWNVTNGSLHDMCSKYGSVVDSAIVRDRETGRCRGFAYVTYGSAEEAHNAIRDMNAQELDGRRIKVDYAGNRLGGGGEGDTAVPALVYKEKSQGERHGVSNTPESAPPAPRSPSFPLSASPSLPQLFCLAVIGFGVLGTVFWFV